MSLALSPDEILRLYGDIETIATVGASATEGKPANTVPAYLQRHGYRIIPVNPTVDTVLGEPAYDSLDEIDQPIDVVQVFRPAAEAPGIARMAADIGAKVLWLQLGIVSDEAAEIAEEAGMTVVMDACMMAVHKKYVRVAEREGE